MKIDEMVAVMLAAKAGKVIEERDPTLIEARALRKARFRLREILKTEFGRTKDDLQWI